MCYNGALFLKQWRLPGLPWRMAVNKKLRLWIVVVLLAWGCAACSQLLPVQSDPASAARGDVLFQDDFSDSNSGWATWSQDVSEVAYRSGGLSMRINQPRYDYWSRPGKRFADVILSVDAARVSGPDNNDFGLICRYRNGDNFYAFLISSDGYYGIIRVQDGAYQVIGADTLQYSAAIQTGGAINQLQAECNGSSLSFSVNGTLLAQAEDSAFRSGEVGLLAGTYGEPGVEILFDNFIVIKP